VVREDATTAVDLVKAANLGTVRQPVANNHNGTRNAVTTALSGQRKALVLKEQRQFLLTQCRQWLLPSMRKRQTSPSVVKSVGTVRKAKGVLPDKVNRLRPYQSLSRFSELI
jgi:hypothetical protein